MLFHFSKPKRVTNKNSMMWQYEQKDRKRRKTNNKQNIATAYLLLGQRLWLYWFRAVAQLERSTVHNIALDVVEHGFT